MEQDGSRRRRRRRGRLVVVCPVRYQFIIPFSLLIASGSVGLKIVDRSPIAHAEHQNTSANHVKLLLFMLSHFQD